MRTAGATLARLGPQRRATGPSWCFDPAPMGARLHLMSRWATNVGAAQTCEDNGLMLLESVPRPDRHRKTP